MIRIEPMVERVKELGQTACAISDHGTLAGVVKFTDACLKNGIKPIIGEEFYIAPDTRFRKHYAKGEHSASHLILFAKNDAGWRNLMALSTKAFVDGFYKKPRIDHALLKEHTEGLIVSSACIGGDIAVHLKSGMDPMGDSKTEFDEALARAKIAWYTAIFGDDFYCEMQSYGAAYQERVNEWYRAHVPSSQLICTSDCHYLHREDADTHDTLLAMGTVKAKGDPERWRFKFDDSASAITDQFYLKTEDEMLDSFTWEEIENTRRLADKIEFELPLRKQFFMPELPADIKGDDSEATFRRECWSGLSARLRANPIGPEHQVYKDRLNYEMDVFIKAGFVEYALLLWDLVRFCQARNIFTGDGRGSGAGSLVLYSLRITNVDPVARECPFERFINAGRLERFAPPDVDLDFPQSRRQEVIDYLRQRYGEERVCQIGTYATLGPAALVRKLAAPLQIDHGAINRLTGVIPSGESSVQGSGAAGEASGLTLDDLYLTVPRFKDEIDKLGDTGRWLLHYARGLAKLGTHASTHASGVLITDRPVSELVPLMNSKDDNLMAQVDMFDAEALGLVKFDILGLKTLDVLEYVDRKIRENDDPHFTFDSIDLDDPLPYQLLTEGRTVGIFQAEGGGFGRLLPQTRPSTVEHLAALTSLCRPGPTIAGITETYIKRARGVESVTYDIPQLEPILRDSYGVMCFQEHIMTIAHKLAGYTLAEADDLRKIMGKKQRDKMPKQRAKFLNGLEEHSGVSPTKGEKLWGEIAAMAEYVFNRSHAMAYSYTTAKCLDGDTKVPLLDGTTPTLKELSLRTEPFWVYSCDGEKIVPGLAHHARSTGVKVTLDVVLDSGEVVRCTQDHRFMLRFGGWKEAQNLVPGDRLMPLYRKKLKAKGKSGKRYEEVYHPALDLWEMTHRMVTRNMYAEAYFDAKWQKMMRHIDHIDDNESNNRPENLQVLTAAQHLRKTRSENWTIRREASIQSIQARMQTPEVKANCSAARRAWWDARTPEQRAELGRIQSAAQSKVSDKKSAIHKSWWASLTEEQRTAVKLKNSEAQKRAWASGRYANRAAKNHSVVAVIEGPSVEVFDLTVDGYENFAVDQGVIVHNCAWAKAYYPAYFLAAAMTSEVKGDGKELPTLLQDARFLGVTLMAPDINESQENYEAITKDGIRVGLLGIHQVGEKAVEAILVDRTLNGPYASKDEFRARLPQRTVNSRVLAALEKAGAFDKLEGRQRLVTTERLFEEFELFNFFLSGHPCHRLRNAWQQEDASLVTIREINQDETREAAIQRTQYGNTRKWVYREKKTRAVVTKIEQKKSKKDSKIMLFVEVEDETGSAKMILNQRAIERFGFAPVKGQILEMTVRKSDPDRWHGYLEPSSLAVLSAVAA